MICIDSVNGIYGTTKEYHGMRLTNTCAKVFCFQIVRMWSAGMLHEHCCKQWKPWEIMFSLRTDQDSNIKINIRNVFRCLPLYLLLCYYFPINYRNTNKKTWQQSRSPLAPAKGGSPTVDGYHFSVAMFPINEKNNVTSVLVSTTHISVVIIFTINRNIKSLTHLLHH